MINLYNSLTRRRDVFESLEKNKVGLYTCGPTVYDNAHIGHWRAYITWDVLKRLLRYHGYRVQHVMNVTDVGHLVSDADEGEDKMELGRKREGKTAWEVAAHYTKLFVDGLSQFNIEQPDHLVPATQTIEDQIALALKLDAAGYLYRTSDGMYFDTSKFPQYGQLALLNKVDLQAGARVDMGEKKNATDFAVWKFSPKDQKRDMEWESPWGKGFPGWHLECSAISMRYLGETFDIHTGGIDHLTVHHPNEMAQSEAVSGKPLARFWMHNAFLNLGEEKMSKSKGGFITLDDLRQHSIKPLAYRFFVLQTHYRKTLNFSWQALEAASTGLQNLYDQIVFFDEAKGSCQQYDEKFIDALDQDLGTPQALAIMQELVSSNNPTSEKMGSLVLFDSILGLNLVEERKRRRMLPQVARGLLDDRKQARADGDWQRSDALRDELDKLGVMVKDTKEGQIAVLNK